ncbi:MAG: primosomal protein N' [Anaerolineales bacterium]|nr:primosomal protein N' [Anaerolineales bacterium]
MTTYLEIVVNLARISGSFHYHLPPELEGKIRAGHLVIVPFGSQNVQGVVLRFVEQPEVAETRPVLELVDPLAVLTTQQIELAQRMARDNLAPLSACISLMLPPGLEQRAEVLYTPSAVTPGDLTPLQSRLLKLLHKRGPLRGGQIDRAMGRVNWRSAARALARRNLVATQSILTQPRARPKIVRTARLACPPKVAEEALPGLGRAGSQALQRRQAMLRFLMREPGPVDVSWIYAESGGHMDDLRFLGERGLVALGESEVWRDPLSGLDPQVAQAPILTQDQQRAWEQVQDRLLAAMAGQEVLPILLHGVTGSGKTEIYLRAVQEVLALGKQAIVLVPEIALTPQTVQRFMGRFPGQVGLIHSGLSQGERYDTWRRARTGELGLVVGPRSALFAPFANLALIVVDECHDESYYQSETAPYYHTRETAVSYARLAGGLCLLGSATPDVTSAYRCQQSQWQYLRLPSRILAHHQVIQAQLARLHQQARSAEQHAARFRPLEAQAEASDLPPVSIVDMRQELQAGNRSIFSRALQAALKQTLEQEQQAILFLNRRGAATYVFCRDCGHTLACPNCNIPLTYHQAQEMLLCHYCNYRRKMPQVCPACGGPRIRHYGTGTQRVEAEVQSMFPEARTLRWDHETTRKKGAHEAILGHFVAHRADVLIGTQMLAKGLDLPLVTLVGAVLADVGLSLPDYRANERAFQVLTQVAGRAGRSPLGGQAILQTFQAEHYVIQAAANHDYQAFYRQELAYRRQLGYPPFEKLVRLEYRHADPARAEGAANDLASQVRAWLEQEGRRATRMIGPVPCFFSRLAGMYRWQIILVGPDPASLLRGRTINDWKIEVNPPNLL